MAKQGAKKSARRVAIVGGLRTPFVKSGTVFKKLSALNLATAVVAELVARLDLDPVHIERVIYGQVVVSPDTPNIAREVILGAGLPRATDGYSVSRACATSTQALVDGAQAILQGDIDVALVGGADSLSRPPVTYQDRFIDALMTANSARDPLAKARPFFDLRAKDWLPKAPAIREASTGQTMGESAEKMAKENGIARADQDAFALRSHQRAAAAWEKGIFDDEVMHMALAPDYQQMVARDGIVRPDTSLEKLSKLRPVFDAKYGSITAANASPLTDGASCVLLMEESRAEELKLTPLAFVKSWSFTAVDPAWQLLMGPAIAIPRALERAELSLDQIDVVDMHEAFAAQVLSNLQALASAPWMEKHAGRSTAVGTVPDEKLNLYGGSIAIGHPFAATGTRQALTMARELQRRGHGKALISQCAAGGLGAALVLER